MARIYSLTFTTASLAAAKDLFRLSAPSTAIVEVLRCEVTQDFDETSQQLPFSLYRASTDGTGTSGTARPLEVSSAAFAGTAVYDLSADTTKSPAEPLWTSAQNALAGWLFHPVPEERIIVPPSGRLVGRIEAAPSPALTFRVSLVFQSVG